MDKSIGQTLIKVVKGDITALQVDAIVNAANTHLWMGGGVADAIKRAGGVEIEREAIGKGPIERGAAIATSAGRLPCRYIIHAATMGQDLVTDASTIRAATGSSLKVADELRLGSVALPALGTGVGGFSLDVAARLMVDEIAAYVETGTALRSIILVGYDDEAADAFERAVGAAG